MTCIDYYIIGFIPVAVVLILIQFILNDWELDIWEEEE